MVNNQILSDFDQSQVLTSTVTPDNMPSDWLWAMDSLSWQNFKEIWSE